MFINPASQGRNQSRVEREVSQVRNHGVIGEKAIFPTPSSQELDVSGDFEFLFLRLKLV